MARNSARAPGPRRPIFRYRPQRNLFKGPFVFAEILPSSPNFTSDLSSRTTQGRMASLSLQHDGLPLNRCTDSSSNGKCDNARLSLIGQDWLPRSRTVHSRCFPSRPRACMRQGMHIIRIVRGPLGSSYTPTCSFVSCVVLVPDSSGILNATARVGF